jgi:hypothetical protein
MLPRYQPRQLARRFICSKWGFTRTPAALVSDVELDRASTHLVAPVCFDVEIPFPREGKHWFRQIYSRAYCGRSKYLHTGMVGRLDLKRHCGIGERFVKRIGDVNFKRHLDAGLQLGCRFEANLEIPFTFYRG